MSVKPPTHQAPGAGPAEDRSATPVTPVKHASLRWVKNVLGRSIRFEQRGNQLHVALVDSRREAEADKPLSLLMQQLAELGGRLLVSRPVDPGRAPLFVVHDELLDGGWPSVEALPLKVIDRALTEAEILGSDESSPLLTTIIDSLRELRIAAEARAGQEALEPEWEMPQLPEVSDTNFDEYELMERSWAGTVPAGLELPSRDNM